MGVSVHHDIEFCLQKISKLGSGIHQWRLNQLELPKEFLKKHDYWERELAGSRSLSSFKCSRHISISANLTAAAIIGWPDDKLQPLLQEGAKPMGPQPSFGIYRNKETKATLDFESLLVGDDLVNFLASTPSPPQKKQRTSQSYLGEDTPGAITWSTFKFHDHC